MSINLSTCALFAQYDPQLLQLYISSSLLADLGWWTLVGNTVLYNVLCHAIHYTTDTSL